MITMKEHLGQILGPVMQGKQIMFAAASFGERAQRLAGIESKDYYYDADIHTEIEMLFAQYLGVFPSSSWDAYNFEAEALGQKLAVGKFGMPDIDTSNPLIKEKEDLYKVKWPTENPLDSGRYPMLFKHFALLDKYLGMNSAAHHPASTFTLACNLMTFPKFMKYIKKDPEFAHEVMRYLVDEIHTPLLKAIGEKYPGMEMMFSDAWEMIPNISPKIQKEFAFKYYDRLIENVKDVDIKISWWMTYGESCMPDPVAYLKEKSKYSHRVVRTCTENCGPEIYNQTVADTGLPFMVHIPSTVIMSETKENIIAFVRDVVKNHRCAMDPSLFSWAALMPGNGEVDKMRVAVAAGNAFSVNPCPTPEELDKIEVTVPEVTESFEEFCRRAAVENPDGFTFKWLENANFSG